MSFLQRFIIAKLATTGITVKICFSLCWSLSFADCLGVRFCGCHWLVIGGIKGGLTGQSESRNWEDLTVGKTGEQCKI